jgi:hypothetical protein
MEKERVRKDKGDEEIKVNVCCTKSNEIRNEIDFNMKRNIT